MNLPEDRDSLLRIEKLLQIRDCRIDFAKNHHVNLEGNSMDFSDPYLHDIYNSLSPTIAIQASTQCGKSEYLIIDHLAMAYCGLSILFVLPKYDLRNRFVQNRINKVCGRVDKYREILGSGFFDSMSLKYFGNGTINYVGSNVEKDFFEIPVNSAVIDEYDQCTMANLRFVEDRMGAATNKYPFMRFAGNPKYPDRGINKKYLLSDQRQWNVPCKACGKIRPLDWFKHVANVELGKAGNVIDVKLRDTEWDKSIGRDIHLICPCGGILDRHSRRGIWIPTNPEGSYEGYHISQLFTRQKTIGSMWASFQDCVYDPSLMDWFYGSVLGLPPSAMGNRVTEQLLEMFAEGPPLTTFSGDFQADGVDREFPTNSCSMGIDVGRFLDVRVSYNTNFHRVCVFVGRMKSKEQLYDIMKKYNVGCAVIDAGPELHLVDDIQLDAPVPVWKCQFSQSEGRVAKIDYKPKEMRVLVDRTFLMDRNLAYLREGKNIIPENFTTLLKGKYAKQMTASVREKVVDANENERYEWTKGEDHHWLADCYDLLASDFVQTQGLSVEIL